MDEAPEQSAETIRENRILAAIVFTDAVAFSKLANRDEKAAFAILSRDFDLMTGICRAHGGRVLNTMGDGMMMCFSSAVEAMQSALKIQQALHAQSQTLPSVSILQHRIGVHLGDIIIDGDNVFGDGVNVAARLQAECKPGAICYSRMVADVIKNKVQIRGRFLGPRHLKNIAEPVAIYEAPSLSEYVTEADPFDEPPGVADADGASGSRAIMLVVGSVAILALVIFAVFQLGKPKTAAVETRSPQPRHSSSPTPETTASPAPSASPNYVAELEPLKRRYDFAAMAPILEKAPQASAEAERVRQLIQMRAWLEGELRSTTASRAIQTDAATKVYQGTRGIVIEAANGINETPFEALPSATVESILAATLAAPPTGQAPPNESSTWLNSFRAEYGS